MPGLQELHWLQIQARVQFKLCTLMYEIHNSQCPAYGTCLTRFSRSRLQVDTRRTTTGFNELHVRNSETAVQVLRAFALHAGFGA